MGEISPMHGECANLTTSQTDTSPLDIDRVLLLRSLSWSRVSPSKTRVGVFNKEGPSRKALERRTSWRTSRARTSTSYWAIPRTRILTANLSHLLRPLTSPLLELASAKLHRNRQPNHWQM